MEGIPKVSVFFFAVEDRSAVAPATANRSLVRAETTGGGGGGLPPPPTPLTKIRRFRVVKQRPERMMHYRKYAAAPISQNSSSAASRDSA